MCADAMGFSTDEVKYQAREVDFPILTVCFEDICDASEEASCNISSKPYTNDPFKGHNK